MRLPRPPRCIPVVALAVIGFAAPVPPVHAQDRPTIGDTARKLKSVHVSEDRLDANRIPHVARILLTRLKIQLRELINQTLHQQALGSASPAQVRAAIVSKLKMAGVHVGPARGIDYGSDSNDGYGDILRIEVQRPEGHSNLLAVRAIMGIACGDDSSLYVFRFDAKGWNLLLTEEAQEYGDVSGALGHFSYAISPPDKDGRWWVVTAHLLPHCTSVWRTMPYKVVAWKPGASRPDILLERAASARWDWPVEVQAGREGFQLTFSGWRDLDFTRNYRDHVLEFRIAGSKVQRIAPIAWSSEDFVDEWLDLPWEEAAQWALPTKLSELETWHHRLQRGEKWTYSSKTEFVQPCGPERPATHWQIGVQIHPERGTPPLPQKLYFSVSSRGEDIYFVDDISAVRPAGCPGETPPE